MGRIANKLIAGFVAISMCVSPIGVLADDGIEEVFIEDNAVEDAGYYDEETAVYDGSEEEHNSEIEFEEITTETVDEDLAFDEPSFAEEEYFVEEEQFVEEDVAIDELGDVVPDVAVDEAITEEKEDTVIVEAVVSEDMSLAGTSGSCGENATWILTGTGSDLTLTISGTGDMTDYSESTIPWSSNRANIKNVIVEPGITTVGNYSFYRLNNLRNVTLPAGLTGIGVYAFCADTKITEIEIPSEGIGESAFRGCTGLTSVNMLDGLTTIGDNAFCDCTGITDIVLPDSVTWIHSDAFSGCTNLKSIELSKNLTDISYYAFRDCTSLTSVILSDSLTNIWEGAFYNCSSLTSIVIPEKVTYIGPYAFDGCSSLESVKLHKGITSIGWSAFYDCSSLIYIDLPDSVSSIGTGAFYGCSSLTNIVIPEGVPVISNSLFYNCSSLTNVTIPESATNIGDRAFYNCTSLSSIEIPGGVTSIENYAFSDCVSLSNVYISGSVTSIGEYAFSGCTSLSTLEVPDSVTSIGCYAFAGSGLTGINLPDDIETIRYGTFTKCEELESIKLPVNLTVIEDQYGAYYDGNEWRDGAFAYCSCLKSIGLPDGLIHIGSYAFYNCTSLSTLEIPDSVRSIGGYAFAGSGLIRISLPNDITTIQYGTFTKCEKLETIKLPAKLTVIIDGNYDSYYDTNDESWQGGAFAYCNSLKYIELPDGLTQIGSYAFYNCKSLSSVVIPDSMTSIGVYAFAGSGLTGITLPDNIKTIQYGSFTKCEKLESIKLPANLTVIEDAGHFGYYYDGNQRWTGGAFAYCSSLKSIELPDVLTQIGTYAFYNCESLETINIPSSIKQFGDDCLYGTPSLYTIIIPGPLSCDEGYLGGLFFDEDGNTYEYLPTALTKRTVLTRVIGISDIELSNDDYTLHIGESITLKPIISPANANQRELIYESYDTDIATVDENGKVKGVGAGSTTIYIRTNNDYNYAQTSCTVIVDNTHPVLIYEDEKNITSKTLGLNQMATFTASVQADLVTDRSVTWSSSDEKVATVSREGVVTAKAPGTTEIVATSMEKPEYKASVSLEVVTVKKINIKEGDSYINSKTTGIGKNIELTAEVLPKEVTDKTVTWSSSDKKVATVDKNGKVTTVGGGTTVVKATSNENSAVSGSVNLEVITVQSVRIKDGSIYPISKDMTVGATTYLTAVVTPTNVTDSSVVWNSNNHGIVTVDQMGKVTAVSKGTAVISAVSKENQEAHGSITINVSVSGETHLAFISAVNAIPDPKNVTDEDKAKIENARTEYEKLTVKQKELIEVKTALEKLVAAEAALNAAEGIFAAQKSGEVLTYDGSKKAPTLIVKGGDKVITSYTVRYVGVAPTVYPESDEAPISAGSYNAIVNLNGDYTGKKLVAFSIEKAEPTVTVPTGLTASTGSELSNVKLPSGWAWDNPDTKLTTSGSKSFSATYTPVDTTNYKGVTKTLTVQVSNSSSSGSGSGSGGTINENQQVADSTKALISALPSTITVSDKDKITAARSAFDSLTDYQKSLIPDSVKKKLTDAETALKEAEKKALDKETADKVKKIIDALPSEVSSQMKSQILSAVVAYYNLTDDQKKLIDDTIKKKLDDMVAALDDADKIELADMVASITVSTMIKMLPEVDVVSLSEKSAIKMVKDGFDKLTPEQKKLVPVEQVDKLNALIGRIESIEKAEQFASVVNSIKGAKAGEGKAKLDKATEILTTMMDEEKQLIKPEIMDSYNSAVSAFKAGTVFKSGNAYYKVLASGNVTYNKPANKKSVTTCTIPNQVKKHGYLFKVVKISTGALNGCENLKWVIVSKNIGSIGKYAFKNTPKLKRIKIMSKRLTDGKVVSAFAAAGKKKGADLTVKTPKGYEGKYADLFKGEGKLNEKAIVKAA